MQDSRPIRIRFNPSLFNNIFWHLKEAFSNIAIRFIYVYGGSSAAKSYSVVQLIITEMLNGPGNNHLVLRKVGKDIKDSIYADFKSIVEKWGLQAEFSFQINYIKCASGSYVTFKGLDDSERIKGISQFKRIIMEEISEFDEVDLKQIKKRLRGSVGQQIVGMFNPISEDHWLKVNVFDKEILTDIPTTIHPITGKWTNATGNMTVLKVTYLDNKYIVGPYFRDDHVIADMEKDMLDDPAYYMIYGLGNWGRLRTGGEFWKKWNPNTQIRVMTWNEDLPLHIGWDKNVNPYLPCSIWQFVPVGDTLELCQIGEIALEDPKNRTKDVCEALKARYPAGRVKGLFVYGDATAIREDTETEKGENMYTSIFKHLKDYHPTRRVPEANPSVVESGNFVDQVHADNIEGLRLFVDPSCKKSIFDYTYALEDSEGGISKKMKMNKVTKVSYQEFGHFSDIKRYIIAKAFSEKYYDYKRGGKSKPAKSGKSAPSKHGY